MLWADALRRDQEARKTESLWRTRRTLNSPQAAKVVRDGRSFLNFCSNDYLGLASHAALANAGRDALTQWGTSSSASHMVCGHVSPHHELERELATFLGTETALLFSTGYMANLAIPATFLGRNDLLLQDKLNHASLVDAARLTRASFKRYPHADVTAAAQHLETSTAPRKILSTDSVFSMDGDIAPLPDLINLCEKTETLLVVDDAHGFGVLGERGTGWMDHFQIDDTNRFLTVGTLGKALGSFGAFVAGSALYIEQLRQTARSYIYTTALPPHVADITRAAIKTLTEDDDRRAHLHTLIALFRQSASELTLPLQPSITPIQPLLMGSESRALQLAEHLEKSGIWATAIRPPTVPKGTSRVRICLSAGHSKQDVYQLLECLSLFDFNSGRLT